MSPRLTATLRSWFARSRLEREMCEEMEAHLEQATELLMARGLSREEAERQAAREFGPVGRIQEEGRDARGALWIESTLADARYAFRQFRRRPVATVTILLVVGLGLGVTNMVFAVLHSVATMPPTGVARDPSLVRIRYESHGDQTYEDVEEFTRWDGVFSEVVISARSYRSLLRPGGESHGLVSVEGRLVSSNYFRTLGTRPAAGRLFSDGDESSGAVIPAVLSYHAWQTYFGGDGAVLGRAVQINDVFVTVVGIAPKGFGGFSAPLVWMPLDARMAVAPGGFGYWELIGRLRPGVSMRAADAAVKTAWAGSEAGREARSIRSALPPDVVPLLNSNPYQRGDRDFLLTSAIAGLASLLFLLVVCTNISALMLGIAATRRREIAVRLSLGASRRRLVRQLVTESVLLALAGGVIGAMLLLLTAVLARRFMPDIPLVLTWPVVAFTFVLALGTGLLTGLSPALHATRVTLHEALKDAGAAVSHGRGRLHSGLISTQIALSQPLLVGLGATVVVAFGHLEDKWSKSLGERVAVVELTMPLAAGTDDRESVRLQNVAQLAEARERLLSLPGVVAAVPHSPDGSSLIGPVIHPADRIPGVWDGQTVPVTNAIRIAGGWLRIFDVPLVAGRDFDRDNPDRDVNGAIIGSTLAKQLWGSADPIGRRIVDSDGRRELTILGVVDEEAAVRAAGTHGKLFIVIPSRAAVGGIAVGTSEPVAPLVPAIRAAVTEAAPGLSISRIRVLAAEDAAARKQELTIMGVAGAGGVLALLLSAIALYALVSLTVAERKRDIGIRTALGAGPVAIVWPYVSRGVRLSVLGLLLGLPVSLLGGRLLDAWHGQKVFPLSAVAALVSVSVLAVVAIATLLPASRAVRMNPGDTLREGT